MDFFTFDTIIIFVGFVAVLAGTVYAVFAIRKEINDTKSNSLKISFNSINFLVPPWWKMNKENENKINFEKVEEAQVWSSSFEFMPEIPEISFEEEFPFILGDFLNSTDILLDKSADINKNSKDFIKDEKLKNEISNILRIEGKGTLGQERRMYLDCFLIKFKNIKRPLLCHSISPVLMGGFEGPYFEKAIYSIHL